MTRGFWGPLPLVLLVLAGCATSAVKDAQADFPCPQLTETWIGDGLKKVSGCGMENVYGNTNDKWVSPKERATFDMDCPRDKLEVHDLGSKTVGVTGCEKKATYVANMLCNQAGCSFKAWVMNTTQ
jgi:hypothetical protein